jgi:hypothetical protein
MLTAASSGMLALAKMATKIKAGHRVGAIGAPSQSFSSRFLQQKGRTLAG